MLFIALLPSPLEQRLLLVASHLGHVRAGPDQLTALAPGGCRMGEAACRLQSGVQLGFRVGDNRLGGFPPKKEKRKGYNLLFTPRCRARSLSLATTLSVSAGSKPSK